PARASGAEPVHRDEAAGAGWARSPSDGNGARLARPRQGLMPATVRHRLSLVRSPDPPNSAGCFVGPHFELDQAQGIGCSRARARGDPQAAPAAYFLGFVTRVMGKPFLPFWK